MTRVKVVKPFGPVGSYRELPDDLARVLIFHAWAAPTGELPPAMLGIPGAPVPPTEIVTPDDGDKEE